MSIEVLTENNQKYYLSETYKQLSALKLYLHKYAEAKKYKEINIEIAKTIYDQFDIEFAKHFSDLAYMESLLGNKEVSEQMVSNTVTILNKNYGVITNEPRSIYNRLAVTEINNLNYVKAKEWIEKEFIFVQELDDSEKAVAYSNKALVEAALNNHNVAIE